MGSLEIILSQLDEREIARRIGIRHDEARSSYVLSKTTVESWDEFLDMISDYYSWHFGRLGRGSMPRWEAIANAQEAIERSSGFKGSNLQQAFSDAHHGTNGGVRRILDLIADHFKYNEIETYVVSVFMENIDPTSWEEKVDIIRQFIARCGKDLSDSIDITRPEMYAGDYVELIKSYVKALSVVSSATRR